MGWTFPSREENPWYQRFVDFVRAADASAFAAREDRNLILSGGGTITWTGSNLTWTEPFRLFASSTGFNTLLAPASLAVADGEAVRLEVVRHPGQNRTVSAEVAAFASNNDNSMLLGIRVGTTFYFRSGVILKSGSSTTYDDVAGGGVSAHASTHLPGGSDALATAAAEAIAFGDASAEGTDPSFARSDHKHAFPAPGLPATQGVGVAGTAGVSAAAARDDHVHPTAAPGLPAAQAIGAGAAGASSAAARADHVHPMVAQAPAAHESTHRQGGSDALKLDDLATPDDNTDLNASISRHGLLLKLSGSANDVLAGDGTWKATVPVGFQWTPDIPENITPHAQSDEFDNLTGVWEPTRWSEFDLSTELTPTVSQGFGVMRMINSGAGINRSTAMYQAIPAANDWAVACKCTMEFGGNVLRTHQMGLFLSQDIAGGGAATADWYAIRLIQGATCSIDTVTFTAYNASAVIVDTLGRTDRSAYFRIRVNNTAGTYTARFDWCDDGMGWHEMGSATLAFTPVHFGIYMRNTNTGQDGAVRVQWVRVIEQLVNLTDLSPGGRLATVYA